MPQLFHVICCYGCETFQVHQVKKIPKWLCKMCGAKQSVKKVYGRGSGADCRKLVQSLNMQKMNAQEPADASEEVETLTDKNESRVREEAVEPIQASNFEPASSKWNQFLDEEEDAIQFDVQEDNLQFTTDRDVMLREEKELRKLRKQEWKSRKRNAETKLYINDNAKRRLVTDNFSSTFVSTKKEHNLATRNQENHDVPVNVSPTAYVARQRLINGTHMSDRHKDYSDVPSKNVKKKHENAAKPTSKWDQYLEVNQDKSSDEDDLENIEQSCLNAHGIESEHCRGVLDVNEHAAGGGTNNHFNLNIDIDEEFDDW